MEFVHSLFIAAILLGFTEGQSDLVDNFRTKKYCGSHLAQALSAICKGNYNSLFKKQEGESSEFNIQLKYSNWLSPLDNVDKQNDKAYN